MEKILLIFVLLLACTRLYAIDDEIKVDQLGYRPLDNKYAVVAMDKASYFRILRSSDNKEMFTGQLKDPVKDDDSGDNCFIADFSSLKTEGSYYMEVDRQFKSYPFKISNDVYNEAFVKSMKAFYLARCGTAVKDGVFSHDACHLKPAFYHVTAGKGLSETRDVSGGWHDAGDYGRYVVNSGLSTATLLFMFERYKAKLEKYSMSFPYKNVKYPDILEEIKWNLDWMLKMQRSDGAVYHKVTPLIFPGFIMPDKDTSQEYVFEISTCATADFAAVMAIASRVFAPYDAEFSKRTLACAVDAYNFLSANPSILPAGGFKNPDGARTGQYSDDNDTDERAWAAVELFNTTGDKDYEKNIEMLFLNTDPEIDSAAWWREVRPAAVLSYLYSAQKERSPELVKRMTTDLKRHADVLMGRIKESGYRLMMKSDDYIWGSNNIVLNYAINLLAASELCGDYTYTQGASEALHYIFGRNPFNMSFVTGLGSFYPTHIHHRPSAAYGGEEPWPGYLAGGPNKGKGDSILQAMSFDTPPMKYYEDNRQSYASNEVAINWNAPLCYVLAAFYKN
jgi:endoglucanase